MKSVKIIYEDGDIIAINKPAGLLVHGVGLDAKAERKSETLVDWISDNYPEIKNVGDEPNLRPGIVHRLDRETSGVLIIAKNQKAFEYLKNLFKKREINKKYIALVKGKIKNKRGVIDSPIGKNKKDFRKKAVFQNSAEKTREAITEYNVLEKFLEYTLVEAYPKTGRTHQIRVHLKSIGHPVVCDKLYGPKKEECPFGLSRHFLHANEIDLILPSGVRIKLEADLPEDLERVLKELRYKA